MENRIAYGKGAVKWVSTDWLEYHLDENRMEFVLIDAQPNVHDYIEEHIPGAVYCGEGALRATLNGIPGLMAPPEAVAPLLGALEVSNNMPIVVYSGTGVFKGWGDGLEAYMLAYALARYGHGDIYLLDGGIDKWKEEDRPLTKFLPRVVPSRYVVNLRREYFIEYDEFQKVRDSDAVSLLDARPAAMYEGQGPWMKAGHIPGAINLPWTSLFEERNRFLLRSEEELRRIVSTGAFTADRTVICYGGTVREATALFLLLKWYFDFPDVRLYEGSFTEWSEHPENPTVIGKTPRLAEAAASTYW